MPNPTRLAPGVKANNFIMKLAVISDIHGNIPALESVIEDLLAWQPDKVIVNGDLVNRGPCSLQGMQLLQQAIPGIEYLQGNHESFVIHAADNPVEPGHVKYEMHQLAQWTVKQLGNEIIDSIRQWQDHIDLNDLEGGCSFHVTHGSRLGNRDGISEKTPEDNLPAKIGDPRDLFVVSHTHRTMLRHFNNTLIVNTGSVGQPFDRDPRSSYGRFSWYRGSWHAEIARVAYDKQRAEMDFYDSGFMEGAGPLGEVIFLEHRQNTMHVGPLMKQYYEAINSGELTLTEAVARYLTAH